MHVVGLTGAPEALRIAIQQLEAMGIGQVCLHPGLALAWSGNADVHASQSGRLVTRGISNFDESLDRLVSPAEIEASLESGKKPAQMRLASPSVTLWLDPSLKRIVAFPDRYALGGLYWGCSSDLSVISSASWIVARLLDRPIEMRALGGLALVGHGVGSGTMFQHVFRVTPGTYLEAADGLIETARFSSDFEAPDRLDANLFRDVVRARAAAYPDAPVEFSGGFDSRLIMAAFDPADLSRRLAYTIGFDDMPDVIVARQLAAAMNMKHELHQPTTIDSLTNADFAKLLFELARNGEFSSNAIDRSLFDLTERERPVSSRFNGQNGELLRGFYYPWQPIARNASSGPIDRLVRWRLVFNDCADPSLFDADWLNAALAEYTTHVTDVLAASAGPAWGSRLDNLYLTERMTRWCGDALGDLPVRRSAIMPFFDHRFVETALRVHPAQKKHGRAQARLISELNPVLARIPFDTGRTPAEIASPPLIDLHGHFALASKSAKKVMRRIRNTRPQTIIKSALDKFYECGPETVLTSLASHKFDFLARDRLDALFSGQWRPNRSTIGMLVNLEALAREMAERADWAGKPQPDTAQRLIA